MTIKFNGIARGVTYYFNVNWSPAGVTLSRGIALWYICQYLTMSCEFSCTMLFSTSIFLIEVLLNVIINDHPIVYGVNIYEAMLT